MLGSDPDREPFTIRNFLFPPSPKRLASRIFRTRSDEKKV